MPALPIIITDEIDQDLAARAAELNESNGAGRTTKTQLAKTILRRALTLTPAGLDRWLRSAPPPAKRSS